MGLMAISFIVAAVLVVLSIVGTGHVQAGENEADAPDKADKPAEPKTVDAKNPAKVEVLKKLRKLAETEPPKKLAPGAMCYDMAAPPQRAEYVCPTCNEKTLYVNEKGKWGGTPQFVSWELSACRRIAKTIKGLKVSLDESAFCKKCQPNAKQKELALVIDYGDPKSKHRVSGISRNDLKLLVEFLDGKLTHDAGQAGQKPLKDYLKRLEQLLGVALDAANKRK